jgi:hypothetical protein
LGITRDKAREDDISQLLILEKGGQALAGREQGVSIRPFQLTKDGMEHVGNLEKHERGRVAPLGEEI